MTAFDGPADPEAYFCELACEVGIARSGALLRRLRAAGAELALALALVVCVFGCTGQVSNATEEQEAATDIAIQAWELRFGFTPACDVDRETLRWEVLADVDAVKARCSDERVDACHLTNLDNASTIVVHSERGRYWTEAYAHELAHWLQKCSGRAPNGDRAHADPAVWPAFESTLRHRLRAELPQ